MTASPLPPRVSVVIPTHNRAGRLPALVAALEAQTLSPAEFEVLFVDDCSTDRTAQVLGEALESSGLDARVLRTQRNTGGPAAPRNLGWQAARAGVIAFVDDDCRPEPAWLEEGLAGMETDRDLGVVQGCTLPPDGVDLRRIDRWAIWRQVTAESPWFECANIFYRRSALDQVGGFDERLVTWGEDTDLGWRVVEGGWGRGYALGAVVVHEIEERGWRTAARFAWKDHQLVALAAKHPEIRQEGFWRPWAIHRQGAEFVAALAGATLATRWKSAALMAVPYLWFRRPPLRTPGTIRIGAQTVTVDAIRLAARLRGSARARILVI